MSEEVLQGLFSVKMMRELIEYLNARTKEYDMGCPTISDADWDASYFQLEKMEKSMGIVFPDSPTQSISYTVVNQLNKVEHDHLMLSLAKTKSISEVEEFLGMQDFLAMAKMDGLSLALTYVDGALVKAETRGNGTVGEDVLHNARVISSIPQHISITGKLEIHGEIICKRDDFEEFSEEYKNTRNFASGSIRLLDPKECQKRKLTFVAWEVVEGLDEFKYLHEKFNKLMIEGFEVVPWVRYGGTVEQEIEEIKEIANNKKYDIDGVVFKFNNIKYGLSCGSTAHHFKNALAYKFYDETYPSTMLDIEWTMGRTGVLTPVAVFEPIEMDGSTVERASLHNVSIMKKLLGETPYIGQKVEVFKANMIIPQIYWGDPVVPEDAQTLDIPDTCPICGEPLEIFQSDDTQFLLCGNGNCEGKLINALDHFCGKKGLDIKGLSKATLDKLCDWGWVYSLIDIFKLKDHEKEWISKSGFGAKSVGNILTAIETSKTVELDKFIAALGIPLIGATVAKDIAKKEISYESFREKVKNNYDFTLWNGFGDAMRDAILNFNYEEADNIYHNYLTVTNSLWEDPSTAVEKTALTGKVIVITGKLTTFKNRTELSMAIEKAGGKVSSSVSKNTTYLINNDNTSNTAKNLEAKKLGIPIITESEFISKFL